MVAQYCRIDYLHMTSTLESGYLFSVFQHWFLRVLDAEREGDLINVTNRFWSWTDFCKTTIMIFFIFNYRNIFKQQHRDFISIFMSKTAILKKYLLWKFLELNRLEITSNLLLFLFCCYDQHFVFKSLEIWTASNSNSL